VQALGTAVFIVLGQAGASVQGAYDALVSMGVIAYFIPYLLMFAAYIRLQREPAGAGVRLTPGGTPVAVGLGVLGFVTTAVSIGLALVPPAGEPKPVLAAFKIIGSSVALVALGVWLYLRGRARRARAA
jgi:amino acid transporter